MILTFFSSNDPEFIHFSNNSPSVVIIYMEAMKLHNQKASGFVAFDWISCENEGAWKEAPVLCVPSNKVSQQASQQQLCSIVCEI